jgi:hypothetical protein
MAEKKRPLHDAEQQTLRFLPDKPTEGDEYHLIGTKDGEIVVYDGPHDSAEDTAEAKELHEQLSDVFNRDPANKTPDRWLMVVTKEVPVFDGRLNEQALRTIKQVDKSIKKRPRNQAPNN